MVQGQFTKFEVGGVQVLAEDNRGHPPEYWAESATDRIVGKMHENMPDHVRQQGQAFRDQIRVVIFRHIMGALRSDRQTIAGELRKSGMPEVARDLLNLKIRG